MFNRIHLALTLILIVLGGSALANPMQPDPARTTAPEPAPMVVRKLPPPPPPLPTLDTIVIIGALQKAVFNGGQEVRIGETIGGYELVEINTHSVTLKRGGRTRIQMLTTAGEFSLSPVKED